MSSLKVPSQDKDYLLIWQLMPCCPSRYTGMCRFIECSDPQTLGENTDPKYMYDRSPRYHAFIMTK
ncbi:hypothetical protein SCLCIDRAFT_1223346 [Scleroderma citrinum Foug A]|uniref:Uncharacterized protein n=1 Tax=Scleroderma citrinum Foug A TaxID=1036808 RepID=A0A0C3D969_9AGAM|nr:hypothetical protein SCLCIDRAFT_1223346 [Scleroderma citrinum Foug A]